MTIIEAAPTKNQKQKQKRDPFNGSLTHFEFCVFFLVLLLLIIEFFCKSQHTRTKNNNKNKKSSLFSLAHEIFLAVAMAICVNEKRIIFFDFKQ